MNSAENTQHRRMPGVKKQSEAHRALENLEEFHATLYRPEDRALRTAVERVISTFKTRLFQALLDIQDYYEETLLDDTKTGDQKVLESNQMADRWQADSSSFGKPLSSRGPSQETQIRQQPFEQPMAFIDDSPPKRHKSGVVESTNMFMMRQEATSFAVNEWSRERLSPEPITGHDASHANGDDSVEYDFEDIILEKGIHGLGFSLAGGRDNPHIGNDPAIIITKVLPGGAAALDGRLREGDIILSVNDTKTVNVQHQVAVDALQRAGNIVRLFIKRERAPTPKLDPNLVRIDLTKNAKGLGFSIAGGIGNEHIPGDTGIYVRKIIDGGAAQHDGRLQAGDKLVYVDGHSLENIEHEQAVHMLKSTGNIVSLLVFKNPYPESVDESMTDVGPPPAMAPAPPPQMIPANPVASQLRTAGYREDYPYEAIAPSRREPRRERELEIERERERPRSVEPPYRATESPPKPLDDIVSYYPPPVAQEERMNVSAYGPRRVTVRKSATGSVGVNIVGGEHGEGIFISHVTPGGPADMTGQIQKGDQLLEVNDVSMRLVSHEEAAAALKRSPKEVRLLLQYKPQEYKRLEQRMESEIMRSSQQKLAPRRELYVRALFDYDPTRDTGPTKGLAFNYGDILHVTNASDDEWWNARKVLSDNSEEGYGIIPSKRRVEKREKLRRKAVNFENRDFLSEEDRRASFSERRGSKTRLSFSSKFPFMKSKEVLNEDSDSQKRDREEPILSYEAVEQQELRYTRPVIVLGPLKDQLNDDLITDEPGRFASCVPHTSRPPRDNEVQGIDYYFENRSQMERDIQDRLYIEAGQYNGHLYGTAISTVRRIADQGKHCVLDVSGNAVRRLQQANLYPITVFIKPRDMSQLIEWNRKLSNADAEKSFARAQMMEQEFGEYFTAMVMGDTPQEIYARVRAVVREESRPVVWVPTGEPLD